MNALRLVYCVIVGFCVAGAVSAQEGSGPGEALDLSGCENVFRVSTVIENGTNQVFLLSNGLASSGMVPMPA